MTYQLGQTKEYRTHNMNTIYDDKGKAICMVYGIASNCMLENLDERDAEGLALARKIVDALNAYDGKETAA